ncbi:phage tail tape measure protein [bacterium]|nr:phage tail tape measure protein [bacterium]
MADTVLDRMVVKLLGDGSSYQKMLKDAEKATKKATEQIGKAGQKLEGLKTKLDAVGASFKKIGSSMRSVGTRLTLSVTAPIAALGGVAIKSFADFDKAMTESTSIMKATTEQIIRMRQAALDLSAGGETTQTPKDLAEAYFFLASAGKDAEQSMSLLPRVAKFATAGNFDMALATDLLTDAQSALGLSSKNVAEDTKNLARVSDVLVGANTLANASVQQFAESLTNTAAASLKNFGKDIEEGVAVLAAYADQGVKGAVAGTSLSRVILLLSKSSRDAAEEHERLGFSVFDANGKMRNFADIVQNLEDVTRGMSDELKSATLEQLGFAARVQQAILPLLGTSEAIRQYEADLRAMGGITERVSDKQMKSFSNQLKILKNQFTVVAIELGQTLAPKLASLAKILQDLIKWWKGLSDGLKSTIVQFLAVAAVIGPLLITVGFMASALGSLATAAGVLSGAFAFLTTATGIITVHIIALQVAIGVGAVIAIVAFSKAIFDANADVKAFNKSVEEGIELQSKLTNKFSKGTAKILQGIGEEGRPEEKKNLIASQLSQAEKELAGYEAAVKGAKSRVEELDGVWSRFTGNKVLADANSELKEQKQFLELAKKRVEAIKGLSAKPTKEAEEATNNVGLPSLKDQKKAAAKAEKEAKKAADKALKERERVFARGKAVMDRFRAPQKVLADRQKELSMLFKAGAIDVDTYTKALKSASDEAEKEITPKVKKARFEAEGSFTAVARGSAAAASRVSAHRRGRGTGDKPVVSKAEQEKIANKKRDEQTKLLNDIDESINGLGDVFNVVSL